MYIVMHEDQCNHRIDYVMQSDMVHWITIWYKHYTCTVHEFISLLFFFSQVLVFHKMGINNKNSNQLIKMADQPQHENQQKKCQSA